MTGDRPAAPCDVEPQRAAEDDGLWADLRRLTAARIGLRRTGASLATGPLLDFRLAHARARDAVHEPLDEARLLAELAELGRPVLAVASAAEDRQNYLLRPDLGRRLAPPAQATLAPSAITSTTSCPPAYGASVACAGGARRRPRSGRSR